MTTISLNKKYRVLFDSDNIIRAIIKDTSTPTLISNKVQSAEFDNESELNDFIINNNLQEPPQDEYTTENNK